MLSLVILQLHLHQNSLEGLLKQVAQPHPQGLWFSRSGFGQRNCVSNKLLGDADAAGLGTTHLLHKRWPGDQRPDGHLRACKLQHLKPPLGPTDREYKILGRAVCTFKCGTHHSLVHLILPTNPQVSCYYDSHFIDEEIDVMQSQGVETARLRAGTGIGSVISPTLAT